MREEGEKRREKEEEEGVRGGTGQERGRNDGLFPLWRLPESLGHRAPSPLYRIGDIEDTRAAAAGRLARCSLADHASIPFSDSD